MNAKSIIILIISLVSVALIASASVSETVKVSSEQISDVGSTANLELTVDQIPTGLAGYNITVSLSDGNVAEIISVDFPSWAVVNSNGSLPGDSVWLKAADLMSNINSGANNVPLATLTVRGDNPGNTTVLLTVNQMDGDNDGNVITPDTVSGWISLNGPPVANDDSKITPEDTSIDITLTANDFVGDTLTYSIVSNPTNGTVSLNGKNVTYTPKANYVGADSFTFKANDGKDDSNVATVHITVTPVNDAPIANDDSNSTSEDTSIEITLTGSDVDGDSLVYSIVSNPTNGAVSLSGNTATYTPSANYNGADSFTFKANDTHADSNVATVHITVTPVNDAPVANNVSKPTSEDTQVIITLTANDVDGDSLVYSIVSNPTNGTVSLTGDKATYTPSTNYHGNDSFTFTANDGIVNSNVATVSINVGSANDAPVANGDSITVVEDSTNNLITLIATDTDGDSLTYTVTQPSHGTVSLNGENATYTPDANYSGADSFTFYASDGEYNSDIPTISITVTAVNDAPYIASAVADITTNEDTQTTYNLKTHENDVDNIDSELVWEISGENTSLFSASIDSNDLLTVTPVENQYGSDVVTLTLTDGHLTVTQDITITITSVNDAPYIDTVIADITTNEDTQTTYSLNTHKNDVDNADLELNWSISGENTSLFSASIDSNDVLTITPVTNQHGSDVVTLTLTDGSLTVTQDITITITPVNDAPHIISTIPNITTNEDSIITPYSLKSHESDVDNTDSELTWSISGENNSLFSASIDSNDLLTVTLVENQHGSDVFTLKLTDGSLNVTQDITITVNAVNDAPVASEISKTTPEDSSIDIILSASDVDGDSLTYSIVSNTTHGNVTLTGDKATYTPDANYNGVDSFTFTANDSKADSNTATVSIKVTAVNDAPVLKHISDIIVNETESIIIKVNATDVDSAISTLTFNGRIHNLPEPVSTTNTFTWKTDYSTVKYDDKKIFSGYIEVTDGELSDKQLVNITVINKNRAPKLGFINNISVSEGGYFIITPVVDEPDNDNYTIKYTANSTTLEDWNNGLWHATNAGTYNINVNVTDKYGLSDDQNVTIEVKGTPPRLFIVNPPKFIEIQDTKFNVSGIVYDNDLANVTLNLNLNNISGSTNIDLTSSINGGWFDEEITLGVGENKLIFQATDGTNLLSRQITRTINVSLLKENEPPKLTIIKPSENNTSVKSLSNQFTIYGQVIDDSGLTPRVNVSNNTINRYIGVSQDGKFATTVTLVKGSNNFTVTATDAVNISLKDDYTISVNYTPIPPKDEIPPVLIITYPPKGLVVQTDKLLVTGYAKDDSGINNITVNGINIGHSNGVFSTEFTLTDGDNTITVNATDSSNNINTINRVVNYTEPDNTTGIIKVEKITLAVSQNVLIANSNNVTNITAMATDLEGRPANNSENVTFVTITNRGNTRTEVPVTNGTATIYINATEIPQTIVLIAGNSTTDILATEQIVVKPEIKIENIMNGLTVTVGDKRDNNSEISMLEGGIILIKSDTLVTSELVNDSQYNNDKTRFLVEIGSGAKLEIGIEKPMLTDSNNVTGEITDIVLNNNPIESDFSDINETIGRVTIDVDVNFSGKTIPDNIEFELSGHKTIDDAIFSIGGEDADFSNTTLIKENIVEKLRTVYNKNADKTHIDNGVAAVIHGKLIGASNDDISEVPITFTLNSSWYNNTAGGKKENVKVFEINETTGAIKVLEVEEPKFNSAGDKVIIKAKAKGFSSFALMSMNSIPAKSGSSPSTSSGGGGGGGGGGGASGEAYENIESIEKYEEEIYKDIPTNYHFKENGLVEDINITGNVNAGLINVKVEVLKDTSTLVNKSAPGNVYRNVNIWVGGAGFAVPQNIKEATITFGVSKNWLDDNGISEVVMYRYTDEEWVQLTTKKIGEENGSVVYYAVTNRFSPYAISGFSDNEELVKSTTEDTKPTDTVADDATSELDAVGILAGILGFALPTGDNETFGSMLLTVGLIILVVSLWLLRRRME